MSEDSTQNPSWANRVKPEPRIAAEKLIAMNDMVEHIADAMYPYTVENYASDPRAHARVRKLLEDQNIVKVLQKGLTIMFADNLTGTRRQIEDRIARGQMVVNDLLTPLLGEESPSLLILNGAYAAVCQQARETIFADVAQQPSTPLR